MDHEVTRDGKIHPKALDRFVTEIWPLGTPWKHSLSGRLKSLASDFETVANATAAKLGRKKPLIDYRFRGAMYQRVSTVRGFEKGIYDVLHLYMDRNDKAHAGLVRLKEFEKVHPGGSIVTHAETAKLCDFFQFAAVGTVELHRLLYE